MACIASSSASSSLAILFGVLVLFLSVCEQRSRLELILRRGSDNAHTSTCPVFPLSCRLSI